MWFIKELYEWIKFSRQDEKLKEAYKMGEIEGRRIELERRCNDMVIYNNIINRYKIMLEVSS